MANQGSGSTQAPKAAISIPDTYMPKDKFNVPAWEAEARYGKTKQPIPATHVYRREIVQFSKKTTKAETWIAVNEQAGSMTFINTYDGKTGAGYDAETFTFRLDPKKLTEKSVGMEQVDVSECPVCVSLEEAKAKKIATPSPEQKAGEGQVEREQRTAK